MKYSIVIPVFNSIDTIDACLRSATNQRGFKPGEEYEVVLVDDGSTDGTSARAHEYPVRIVRLDQNSGRIMARLTGARAARASRILFIDSRVSIPEDTLSKVFKYDLYPAVMGVSSGEIRELQKGWDLVFYLVRRKYYGKEYFPLAENKLLITKENFKRAPKGTTLLLIDRDLFIRLTPERTGKGVSDDTLLLRNLVFEEKIDILRTRDLVITYTPRTKTRDLFKWLSHRGILFSDFYLAPGGYFYVPFLVVAAIIAAILPILLTSPFLYPKVFMAIVSCLVIAHVAAVLYLIETKADFLCVFLRLPVLLAVFGSGIVRYWFKRLHAAGIRKRL